MPTASQADEREIIIQWRQPPFVKGTLIRNQVGNAPGEQVQNVAAQIERFLNGCGSFHRVRRFRLYSRSLTRGSR